MKKRFVAASMAVIMAVVILTGCGSSSAPQVSEIGDETHETNDSAAGVTKETSVTTSAGTADVSAVWPAGTTVYFDVPAKAGGGTDLFTRYLTQALGEVYPDVNFVVTNYDTEEIGMQNAKNAAADGTHLLASHGGAIIKYMTGTSGVSLKNDMRAVGLINQGGPQAVIANPGAEYSNFAEFAEYVKAHPGEITIGCSLGGTTQIFFTSLMQALVGDPDLVNYVQCSSEADKLTQVASGSINIANCSIPNAVDYDADGKVTILGTLGPKASTLESMNELLAAELDPKFASTVEQGVNVTWDTNYYIVAPAGVSDEKAEMINAAIMAAEEANSFKEGMKKMATFAVPTNLAESQGALDTEWDSLDSMISDLGLKVQ